MENLCELTSNVALCQMTTNYVVPICKFLSLALAGYLLITIAINLAQAALSGTLGDPRGRAHATEQIVVAVVFFAIGVNADKIAYLIIGRLIGAGALAGAAGAREAMLIIFEFILQIVTGLVLLGLAASANIQIGLLNIAHSWGMGKGAADAMMSISLIAVSAVLILMVPYLGKIIVGSAIPIQSPIH